MHTCTALTVSIIRNHPLGILMYLQANYSNNNNSQVPNPLVNSVITASSEIRMYRTSYYLSYVCHRQVGI